MDYLRTGLVTKVVADGVWCEIPSLAPHHEFGPFEIGPFVLQEGDRVLLGQVSDTVEDMVVLMPLLMEYVSPVPANANYILYFENETAMLAAGLTLESGLAVWLDDEARLDIYTDEPTAGWISIYGEKGGKIGYPFGMKVGLGQPNPEGFVDANGTSATDWLVIARVLFDPQYRWRVNVQGDMQWGTGSATQDTTLQRANADGLQLSPGLGINIAPDADSRLKIQNTTAARRGLHLVSTSSTRTAAHVYAESHASSATVPAFSSFLTGEDTNRLDLLSNGTIQWSDGATAADTSLSRGGENWLITPGGLNIGTFLDVADDIDCSADVYVQSHLFVGPTFNDVGRGLWAVAQSSSDSSATSGTTELVLLTTASTTYYANRAYEIRFDQRFSQGVATASMPVIAFRKTNVSGQQLTDLGREQLPASTSTFHISGSAVFIVGGSDVTASICQTITPSAATNITQKAVTNLPRAFQIWDIGPASNFTGHPTLV